MLYTLNRDMIARQKRQNQRLSEYVELLPQAEGEGCRTAYMENIRQSIYAYRP